MRRLLPALRRILQKAELGRARRTAVDITFVDDRSIAACAGSFRGSPRPTDVLAFGYQDAAMPDEIVISFETAFRQARERGRAPLEELALLCVHGLWHLAGQDDETRATWEGMRRREFETLVRALG